MDPRVGDLATGDLLIEGTKIAAIAPAIDPAGAQVIEAADTIIVPGFVDCHRHSWEAQLRRINPNSPTLPDYMNATHLSFAKAYRPQDHYVGNYLTAAGCIDGAGSPAATGYRPTRQTRGLYKGGLTLPSTSAKRS